MTHQFDLLVIGGGPAGYMAAIKAAEEGLASVLVLEASLNPLEKVRISGGGRCNVTHACWDPSDLIPHYPRGSVELRGPFSLFAAGDAVSWFSERGMDLIVEEDGRMFPTSNSSAEVISCLQKAADKSGVSCLTKKLVTGIRPLAHDGFLIQCSDKSSYLSRKVLLATGGNSKSKNLAFHLGHNIIPSAPSLFSFKIAPHPLLDCAGISVGNVKLKLSVNYKTYQDEGRILITHKGISGPAILRLSSFAARDLFVSKYDALLDIKWVNETQETLKTIFNNYRQNYSSRIICNVNPFQTIPKRLWLHFLLINGIEPQKRWSSFSIKEQNLLVKFLLKNSNKVKGRGPFGEEFVTAGGVPLEEVNFNSMESLLCEGLYFSGEILDVDGLTGGFNFQHCWTSGWIAGRAISQKLLGLK